MDQGRWTDAERSFREAASLDPDFLLGVALVARISNDLAERERLLSHLKSAFDDADDDSKLLLEVFMMNVDARNVRERGSSLPEGFIERRTKAAVANFSEYVRRHPEEAHIRAELVEWTHNAEGADAALGMLRAMPAEMRAVPCMIGIESMLASHLGDRERAWDAFERLRAVLDDPSAPALSYTRAVLLRDDGDEPGALASAEEAVMLDPNHLLAVRLAESLRD